jgi:hypothetical protein
MQDTTLALMQVLSTQKTAEIAFESSSKGKK